MSQDARIADDIRKACLDAAREAYESAGRQGLCAEGRWEAALGAIQMLDLKPLLEKCPPD
jgi:hypothetical protein